MNTKPPNSGDFEKSISPGIGEEGAQLAIDAGILVYRTNL
jgi:hypothetical protein